MANEYPCRDLTDEQLLEMFKNKESFVITEIQKAYHIDMVSLRKHLKTLIIKADLTSNLFYENKDKANWFTRLLLKREEEASCKEAPYAEYKMIFPAGLQQDVVVLEYLQKQKDQQ